jgi:hypothetical protein
MEASDSVEAEEPLCVITDTWSDSTTALLPETTTTETRYCWDKVIDSKKMCENYIYFALPLIHRLITYTVVANLCTQ